jgi:phosphoribosylformylglycinamidine synthase subunit PurQ / glutaminase
MSLFTLMTSPPRVAVILFPGTNCEDETVRALRRVGLEAEVVRWNEGADFEAFDGYIFPGGFSFEDRGRSGLVASFDPIVDKVMEQAAKGKVVVGICNGCQILVDRGFVPGGVRLAMGWNVRVVDKKVQGRWVSRTPCMKMSGKMAEDMGSDIVMKAPVAHGEGRFASLDPGVFDKLEQNGQIVLQYCDEKGNVAIGYPENPNGAPNAIAGICNPTGNVVAFMPHPERVYPREGFEQSDMVFEWMKKRLEAGAGILEPLESPIVGSRSSEVEEIVYDEKPVVDIEILTELMITDNEAWTIEQVARRVLGVAPDDKRFALKKQIWWGVNNVQAHKDIAPEIIRTNELCNLNKEKVRVMADGKMLEYRKSDKILHVVEGDSDSVKLLALEREDTLGASKLTVFADHHEDLGITDIQRGVLWSITGADEDGVGKLVSAGIFYNSASMTIAKYEL